MQILWIIIGVVGVAAVVYPLFIRPRQLRWGATQAEVDQKMPGDDIVIQPNFMATRAVTVNATPEKIWP
jgi:hypothetical protein